VALGLHSFLFCCNYFFLVVVALSFSSIDFCYFSLLYCPSYYVACETHGNTKTGTIVLLSQLLIQKLRTQHAPTTNLDSPSSQVLGSFAASRSNCCFPLSSFSSFIFSYACDFSSSSSSNEGPNSGTKSKARFLTF
jgi:hypothetical protein